MDCCEEMQLQLDMTYILRRLVFVDALASKLLDPHELDALYIRKKTTL